MRNDVPRPIEAPTDALEITRPDATASSTRATNRRLSRPGLWIGGRLSAADRIERRNASRRVRPGDSPEGDRPRQRARGQARAACVEVGGPRLDRDPSRRQEPECDGRTLTNTRATPRPRAEGREPRVNVSPRCRRNRVNERSTAATRRSRRACHREGRARDDGGSTWTSTAAISPGELLRPCAPGASGEPRAAARNVPPRGRGRAPAAGPAVHGGRGRGPVDLAAAPPGAARSGRDVGSPPAATQRPTRASRSPPRSAAAGVMAGCPHEWRQRRVQASAWRRGARRVRSAAGASADPGGACDVNHTRSAAAWGRIRSAGPPRPGRSGARPSGARCGGGPACG